MRLIATEQAPQAIGPYSQAIQSGNLLFCSGQLGIDPRTAQLAGDDIRTQTQQVFRNLGAVLHSRGINLQSVVKSTVFLADLGDFTVFNELYAQAFDGHKPARSTVQVARLPLDARVEIEIIAELSA